MTIEQLANAFAAGKPGRCHNAHTDGQTYWLHQSPIAVKTGANVQLYWHGWYTPTTASHMNAILRALGSQRRVSYAHARDTQADYELI